MLIKEEIKKEFKNIGLEEVYFLNIKTLIEEVENKEIKKYFNKEVIEMILEYKTIIIAMFPYSKSNDINKNFSKYTQGKDYHEVIKEALGKISKVLEKEGYSQKILVDNNILPEKILVPLAGGGNIGKNTLIFNEKYGSFCFIGEILTTLEIETDIFKSETFCDSCNTCVEKCPTKALQKEKIFLNTDQCISSITQKKNLDLEELEIIKNRIWGCDICQDVCPVNIKNINHVYKGFEIEEEFKNLKPEEIINLNKESFDKFFKNKACGYKGKNIIIRNALNYLYHRDGKKNFAKNFNSSMFNSKIIKDFFDIINL